MAAGCIKIKMALEIYDSCAMRLVEEMQGTISSRASCA